MKSRTVLDRCNYVRFHPFEYAHTDTVVRLDSSIGIKKSLAPIIEAFRAGDYDRCLLIHPTRNTFPDELAVWVRDRHYSQEVADRCLKMMKAWGYDFDEKGLFQGTFEIVRNTEVNRDINRMVYHLMKYTGGEDIDRVDQHITTFVIHTQFPDLKILPVSENLITMDSPYMQWYLHHSMVPIANPKKIAPMMFNQPCECWDSPKSPSKPKTKKSTNRKGK